MGLLGSFIVTVCMGAQGSYRAACNNALDAGSKQSGVDKEFRTVEQNGSRLAEDLVTDALGDYKNLTGGMVFIIKSAAEGTIVLPIPTGGYADNIQGKITDRSLMFTIGWTF